MTKRKKTRSKNIDKYAVLMNFKKAEEVPVHDLAKQWGVSFQKVVFMYIRRNHDNKSAVIKYSLIDIARSDAGQLPQHRQFPGVLVSKAVIL